MSGVGVRRDLVLNVTISLYISKMKISRVLTNIYCIPEKIWVPWALWTPRVTERTWFSKSRPNDLEDIGQGQRSSHATHLLMLVIICTKIWKESIKNCRCYREDTIFKVKAEWPWRYRSRSKVITCDTSSHASDHLYQIWKESINNCRCYREDTIFKVKAEWPWR